MADEDGDEGNVLLHGDLGLDKSLEEELRQCHARLEAGADEVAALKEQLRLCQLQLQAAITTSPR